MLRQSAAARFDCPKRAGPFWGSLAKSPAPAGDFPVIEGSVWAYFTRLHRQPADGAFVARPVHGLGIHRRGGGGEGAGIQHPLRAVIAVVQGHVLLGGGQGHISVAALGNDGSLGGRGILHHGEGHGGGGAGGLVGELHRHHVLALLQLRAIGEHLGDGLGQHVQIPGGIQQLIAVDLQAHVAVQGGDVAADGKRVLVGVDHRAVGDALVVKPQGRGLGIRQIVQYSLYRVPKSFSAKAELRVLT